MYAMECIQEENIQFLLSNKAVLLLSLCWLGAKNKRIGTRWRSACIVKYRTSLCLIFSKTMSYLSALPPPNNNKHLRVLVFQHANYSVTRHFFLKLLSNSYFFKQSIRQNTATWCKSVDYHLDLSCNEDFIQNHDTNHGLITPFKQTFLKKNRC